jgi:hypothetical protein
MKQTLSSKFKIINLFYILAIGTKHLLKLEQRRRERECENVECCPTLEKRGLASVFIRIWVSPTIANWFWL